MATRRSYADPCGIARALDVVGERWALLVVRELLLGPKRYSDLRAGLPGVSTDVLAQRLRDLERAGVVRRTTLPPPGAAKVYELTDRGHDLEPVLHTLGRWGSREPLPAGDRELGTDAFAAALATLFEGAAADGLDATVELRLGTDVLTARVRDGGLRITRGGADAPDVTLTGDVAVMRRLLWRGQPRAQALAQALDEGAVRIEGDRTTAARFLTLFPAAG